MESKATEQNIVVTHRGCSDGFAAATVAHAGIFGFAPMPKNDNKEWLKHFYATDPGAEHVRKTILFLAERYTPESKVKFFDVSFEQAEFDLLLDNQLLL
jgi:hypothetical protein